jgi:16S rRNA (uracil1498-N3)-methyltransferase
VTATRFNVERKNIRPPFAWLEGSEHHHLSKVLRRRPGQRVLLADEDGNTYSAEVVEVGAARTRLKLLGQTPPERAAVTVILAQSLLKAKKMDMVVQKATELGVDVLVPLVTDRSVVKLAGDEDHKVERWRKIVREAAKQSRRSLRPEVLPPQTFREFLARRSETRKLILTENSGKAMRDVLTSGPGQVAGGGVPTVLLVVGPEGGWTKEEEAESLTRGFEAVSLGKRPLRSETAALAALAMVSHFWKA